MSDYPTLNGKFDEWDPILTAQFGDRIRASAACGIAVRMGDGEPYYLTEEQAAAFGAWLTCAAAPKVGVIEEELEGIRRACLDVVGLPPETRTIGVLALVRNTLNSLQHQPDPDAIDTGG